MHISGVVSAHVPQLAGKSKEVPPGLQRRELDLPPGIAKKLEADGTAPPGIAKRFPAAISPTETASETTTTPPVESATTVDLLA